MRGAALCCWPSSDESSGKYSRKSTIDNEWGAGAGGAAARAASAATIHQPGIEGGSRRAAHRSHEELGRRRSSPATRRSSPAPHAHCAPHASAPSVILQVLHRRDWDRSSRELHIPLRPDAELEDSLHSRVLRDRDDSDDDDSFAAPLALTESASIDDVQLSSCKKHHANIKSSRKESHDDDAKDVDATELSFYIGDDDGVEVRREDTLVGLSVRADSLSTLVPDVKVCRLKDEKQTLNESIKSMERSLDASVEYQYHPLQGEGDEETGEEPLDRSGATRSMQHSAETPHLPNTPSIEAVEYGSCVTSPGEAWSGPGPGPGAGSGPATPRPRHASDTDVVARAGRPRSVPFSESDLELDSSCKEPRRAPPLPPPPPRETAV